jgi:hypothetical protein
MVVSAGYEDFVRFRLWEGGGGGSGGDKKLQLPVISQNTYGVTRVSGLRRLN